jgi:arsenite methyltransferase
VASEMDIKTCCVASYTHPLARWFLGDSLHPGGLTLTTRLARMAGVGPQSLVLDAGSGLGASSVHLAQTVGCRVVGVTLEEEGVARGARLAGGSDVADRVTFLEGDIQEVDLMPGSFDVAFMECVLSLVSDKRGVLRRIRSLLRSGGSFALSDVTLKGPLPEEMRGVAASVACMGATLPLEGYRHLVKSAGFDVEHIEDLPEVASNLLRDFRDKLLMAEIAVALGKLPVDGELLAVIKRYLALAEDMVRSGTLSYGMLVARRL